MFDSASRRWRRFAPLVLFTMVAASAAATAGAGREDRAQLAAEQKAAAQAAQTAASLGSQGSRSTQSSSANGGGSVGSQTLLQAVSGGTTSIDSGATGVDGIQSFELFPNLDVEGTADDPGGSVVNRRLSHGHGGPFAPPGADSAPVVSSPAGFAGINHRDQRLANGGNQFSLEPPDQGLCAGNGFVLETVNDALRIYNSAGAPQTGTIALNAFYGYPPAILRSASPPVRGPFVTDPSCYYDTDTQRWFHVVLTLDVVPSTGAFTGGNHLDIAVSNSPDPTGSWHIYRIQVANDNSAGTGNHPQCPCLGDYPHIGADATGFYITTNEYSFFKNKFNGAQIYAMSKRALARGDADPAVVSFDNLVVTQAGTTGFTVWPATSPPANYATVAGGTEYFLSSMAGEEAGNKIGFDNRLGLWALTNTQSLDSTSPDLALSNRAIDSEQYGIPPASDQRPGNIPLADCVNDGTTVFGTTSTGAPVLCRDLVGAVYRGPEVEGPLDSSDTRMQQVFYAGGLLYGALDTTVNVGGVEKAGIAWFIVRPSVSSTPSGKVVRTGVDGTVVKQGYLAVAGNNVIYPAIAVRSDGKGIMAFTLVGADHYPSAAYASIDATNGVGTIQISHEGAGPQDGFSEYKGFRATPRPRWGDYGAAAVDGATIWIASEYIGQTCTYAQYIATPFGSCSGTRTSFANWGTYITPVAP